MYNKYYFETLGMFAERKKAIEQATAKTRLISQNEEIGNKYIAATQQDLSDLVQYFFLFSQYEDNLAKKNFPFTFNFANDSLVIINISLMSSNQAKITISVGALFSLTDLMNRICCNKDFMSFCLERNQIIWEGTNCYWPHSHQVPRIRFDHYQPIHDERPRPADQRYIEDSLGKYLCGVPIGDDDRLYLANLLVFLSFTWMMLHEEGHHWNGHLVYMKDHEGESAVSETSGKPLIKDIDIYKIFELQADFKATVELFDLIYNVEGNLAIEVPDALKYDTDFCSSARTFIVAVGSLILVMQRSQIVKDIVSYYPSNKTRFVMLLNTFLEKVNESFFKDEAFYGNSIKAAFSKLRLAFYSAMYDLLTVEDILVNNVDQVDFVERIFFEKNLPDTLSFIKNEETIGAIIDGIFNGCEHPDAAIDREWFAEYRRLNKNSGQVYNEILPDYRKIVQSPYKY